MHIPSTPTFSQLVLGKAKPTAICMKPEVTFALPAFAGKSSIGIRSRVTNRTQTESPVGVRFGKWMTFPETHRICHNYQSEGMGIPSFGIRARNHVVGFMLPEHDRTLPSPSAAWITFVCAVCAR